MRNAAAAALLVASLAGSARAAFNDKDVGTAAGTFLKLGPDARSDAVAGAVHSTNESASAIYWNPAGLATLRHREVTLSHTAYFQNVFYDYVGYAQPIDAFIGGDRRDRSQIANDYGAIGVGVVYLNAGQIGEVDNTGLATGDSFTPQDFSFMAGWGLTVAHDIDVGITGKYVSERIKDSASTGAFDFGARYHLRLASILYTLSAGAQNLGGQLKFIQAGNPLPLTLYVGNSLRLTKDWTVSFDVIAPRDDGAYPAFGTEYRFVLDPEISAALRAGYQRDTSSGDLGGLTGISLGAGLGLSRFSVDYAWAPFGVLGDAHHFSLSYRF